MSKARQTEMQPPGWCSARGNSGGRRLEDHPLLGDLLRERAVRPEIGKAEEIGNGRGGQ